MGIGGSGKTQLAFKVLKFNKEKFDLIIPVFIESAMTFRSFLTNFVNRLSISIDKLDSEHDIEDRVIKALEIYPKVLLYLDNFDVLVGDNLSEEFHKIRSFIRKLPSKCRILLCSQVNGNIDGDYVFHLEGLNPVDGVKLFLTTAKDQITSHSTKQFIEQIFKLVKSIGGHPLAIRLLGKSYQGGGPDEISGMIKTVDMSYSNGKEEIARFKTLNACFAHSFNRLDDKQKNLLLNLTIFNSPFSWESVLKILAIRAREFNSIVNKGYLEKLDLSKFGLRSDKFFYFFHPLVRKYLEEEAKRRRISLSQYEQKYCNYFEELIEKYTQTLDPIDIFHPWLLILIANHESNDFEVAISLIRDKHTRSKRFTTFGLILQSQYLSLESRRYHQKSLGVDLELYHEELRHEDWIADDYQNIGNSYLLVEPEIALSFFKKNLNIVDKIDKAKVHLSYSSIGLAYFAMNDKVNCLKFWTKSFDLARKIGNHYSLLILCNQLAGYYSSKVVNYYKALGFFMAALVFEEKRTKQRDMIYGIINDYNNISFAYKNLKLYHHAMKYASLGWLKSMEYKYIHGALASSKSISNLYKKLNEPNLSAFFADIRMKMRGNLKLNESKLK